MRTLLICHDDAALDKIGLARWLASFSTLTGIVSIREPRKRTRQRVRREIKRVGLLRFTDVLAFRVYYGLFLASRDRDWETKTLGELCEQYPPVDVPTLITTSPNSTEAENFIRQCNPELVIARCKYILKESIFSIPSHGTFVMHPGICPEYRNAHGCFWALANDDLEKVGMTLLKIDRGVDTGPVYGHYHYSIDGTPESHVVIQHKLVTANLAALESKFREIYAGTARTIDVAGRKSNTWGQPWLTQYLALKKRADKRRK